MKQTFNQQIQSLTPEFQQRYYEEQQKEWNATVFTSTAIHPAFFSAYREFALMFETPVGMNVSPTYFIHLMEGDIEVYYVSDIVLLCQAFQRRTKADTLLAGWQHRGLYYQPFITCMEQITNEVNAIVEPIKDRLIRKMQTEQSLQTKAGNRKIVFPTA